MLSLGKRIREIRLKKGLTQIDLAKGLCTPSMISQIESDRARPSYKMLYAIAERLDVPLDHLLKDVDLNLEYLSSYRMARAMLASKQYASAVPLYQELLDTPHSQISTADLQFDLGECLLHVNRYEEAEKVFSHVHELAVFRQDTKMTVEVLRNMGTLAYKQKNHQLALYQWQRAIDEAEKIDEQDDPLQADIFTKMATAYWQIGYVAKAIDFFVKAASLYEGFENPKDLAHVYMGLGMSYKNAGDLEKAVSYSERAISIFEGQESMEQLWRYQIQMASLVAETRGVEEAEKMLRVALVQLEASGMREWRGVALVVLAKVLSKKEELEQAVEACREARSLLPELHESQAEINRIMGKVALKQGNVSEAKRRLQMAADGFKRNNELSEWDQTMFHLVQLHQQEGKMEEAIRTLTEMRRFTRQALSERGIDL